MEVTESFDLEIIRPASSKKIHVAWVRVQGINGDFVVGPNHGSLIALLKRKGDLTYQRADGKRETIDVFGGIFKVNERRAIVLLDS